MSKTKKGAKSKYASPHDSDKKLKQEYNRRLRRVNKKSRLDENDFAMIKDEACDTYDIKPAL